MVKGCFFVGVVDGGGVGLTRGVEVEREGIGGRRSGREGRCQRLAFAAVVGGGSGAEGRSEKKLVERSGVGLWL